MSSSPLASSLVQELKSSISGGVFLPNDPEFTARSTAFNGNVRTSARAVACPVNAEDVSKILMFCTKHSLYPSIKAGGYGTAGWAISGDIIIDLGMLVGVDIEPPQPGGSYTSLRDMPFFGSKGKGKTGALLTDPLERNPGKRTRAEYEVMQSYDLASPAVARFLRGPTLPQDQDGSSPVARRRLEYGVDTSSTRNESSSMESRDIRTFSRSSHPTAATSLPLPQDGRTDFSSFERVGPNPFGYVTDDENSSTPSFAGEYASIRSTMDSQFVGNTSNDPSIPLVALPVTEPLYSHAYVTFGAGMKQKEVDTFTAKHQLEAKSSVGDAKIPYHVPFSAHPVGSSVMLLGGFGFLSRLHGLSTDNLVEVEMVLTDGRIVIVNRDEHPDLWWALRGAGPAFGVATRYKARAYPVPVVFAGNLIYRFRRATAPSLIKHFRDCVKGAPRELYANVLLTAGPAGKDSLVVIQMCYIGPKEKGREYLATISSWDGEPCLLNEVDEKSFLHQQDSVAQVLRGKAGNQWFIRSSLITSLPDDIVNKTVIEFADSPHGCTWLFELSGGAIPEFEDTCLPKANREAAFTIAALHQWPMDFDDPRCVELAEEWITTLLGPVSLGAPFPSFLGLNDSPTRTMGCYGENWRRLCEIKKQYDPTGLFRHTFWPLDAKGELNYAA